MENILALIRRLKFKSIQARWFYAISFQAFLYGSLSVMPDVVAFLTKNIDLELSSIIFFGSIALAVISLSIKIFKLKLPYYFGLVSILVIYGSSINQLSIVVERIHFFQYGILTLLVLWAIDESMEDAHCYLLTLFYIFLSGCLDEFIQFFLPNRVFDIRDIVLNAFSGFIALCLIGLFSHAYHAEKK